MRKTNRSVETKLAAGAAAMLLCMPAAHAEAPAAPSYRLEAGMARGQVFNPWTLSHDGVEVRAYRNGPVREGAFVGPEMRVGAGQTLSVELENRLPACTAAETRAGRCWNATNLHTHGLWVSPSGASDNVMISVEPRGRFRYRFEIPKEHPAGTFWYHAHPHGSTSVQLSSGMAGALIVTGDRKPSEDSPGDVDILLREAGRPLPERVLLFQQMQYACLDREGRVKSTLHDAMPIRPWVCAPGEVGRVYGVEGNAKQWPGSGRFIGINGRVQPRLDGAVAGRFERWRLIHGGLREPVHLRLFRLDPAAPDPKTVPAAQQRAWIARYCTGRALPMWRFAADGLTTAAVRRTERAVLFPGNRVDVLAWFPAAGRYCLIDEKASWFLDPEDRRILSVLQVGEAAAPVAQDPGAALQTLMINAAERALAAPQDAAVRKRVTDDLRDGLRLGAFVPHRPIADAELTGRQEAVINLVEPELPTGVFSFDGKPFEHGRIDRRLPLGGVEEWRVTSRRGNHPFHIHVNPFQVVGVTDREGRDVTSPNSPAFDPDYEGIIGEWRDTLMVKNGHRAVLRTRYERFTGDFLVHCHFAGHGDRGMMQLVRIEAPGAAPSPAAAHHH